MGNQTGVVRAFVVGMISVFASAVTETAAGQERQACRGATAISVTVLDESASIVLPHAVVVLRWTDGVRRPMRQATDSEGRLMICVPPDARRATVWAEFGDDSSEEVVVSADTPEGDLIEVELRVLLGAAQPGRVVGTVRDRETGDPVATVALSLGSPDRQVETDRQGRFMLSGVPAGEYELAVRRIGYRILRHPISVTRGLTTQVDIELAPEPLEMEPLMATVTRPRRLEISGFYERKYWGELVSGGTFFTEQDIERRRPLHVSHMIADAQGMRVRQGRLMSTRMSSGFSGSGCEVNVYIDSARINGGSHGDYISIDTLVRPIEVAGIEVYSGPAQLPAEFSGYDARCGAVVIWTK